jgi:hypothetical protein
MRPVMMGALITPIQNHLKLKCRYNLSESSFECTNSPYVTKTVAS